MAKKIIVVVAIILIVCGLSWSTLRYFHSKDNPVPPKITRTTSDEKCTLNASTLVNLINQARENNGEQSLTISSELTQAAQAHLNDMVKNQYYGHNTPSGETPEQQLASYVGSGKLVGQVIDDNACNDQGFFNDYMNSPEHKAILLDSQFKYLGIAEQDGVNIHGIDTIDPSQDNLNTPNLNVIDFSN